MNYYNRRIFTSTLLPHTKTDKKGRAYEKEPLRHCFQKYHWSENLSLGSLLSQVEIDSTVVSCGWSYQLLRRDLIITRATEFVGFFGRSVWVVWFFKKKKKIVFERCLFVWLIDVFCLFVWGYFLLRFFVSQQGCFWWTEVRKNILCGFPLTCEKIGKTFKGKYSILSRLKCRCEDSWFFFPKVA